MWITQEKCTKPGEIPMQTQERSRRRAQFNTNPGARISRLAAMVQSLPAQTAGSENAVIGWAQNFVIAKPVRAAIRRASFLGRKKV